MLKLKQTYTNFLKDVYIGTRAFFIEIDGKGYEEKTENLAQSAASFSTCVIYGEEPFNYQTDIAALCVEIQKLNPYTKILIYTNGLIRPSGMNTVKNVTYIIHSKLTKSGITYSDRINENAFKWFAKTAAHFIFSVEDVDELDEIQILIAALVINKSQIYVDIKTDNFNDLVMAILNYGFNVFVEYSGVWFDDESEE